MWSNSVKLYTKYQGSKPCGFRRFFFAGGIMRNNSVKLFTKYQGSRPCGFREVFSCFPYIRLCKTCDHWGGPILGHSGKI